MSEEVGDGANPLMDANLNYFKSQWKNFGYAELQAATSHFSQGYLIGKGDYAEVYRGRLRGGQLVAIKCLTRGSLEEKISDILSELGTMAHVNHLNIAKLIGYGVEGGMEMRKQVVCNSKGSGNIVQSVNWDWVWQVKVPPKVRVFMWRVLKNSLPVFCNLRTRGVDVECFCPICKHVDESVLHVLRDCSFARLFWAVSHIPYHSIYCAAEQPRVWVESIRSLLSGTELEFFFMSCWQLWGNRNKVVHEGMGYEADRLILYIHQQLARYVEAQNIFTSPRPPDSHVQWSAPVAGRVKINFDGGIHNFKASSSAAVVAHDHSGSVLAWRRIYVPYIVSPVSAEPQGALLDVRLALNLQLNDLSSPLTSEGSIIEEARLLARSLNSVNFIFVRRSGNNLAHFLAKGTVNDSAGTNMLPQESGFCGCVLI